MYRINVDAVNISLHNGPMPSQKRRYHHPDLRQTLLDSAVRLIEREGLGQLSMRKLAALAGVSHAAPYRHFKNKDAIVAALMLEGHRRLKRALAEARLRTPGAAWVKLAVMGRAYVEFAHQNPEYMAVMFTRAGMASAMSSAAELEAGALPPEEYDSFGELERTVRDCQAEGSLDPGRDSGGLSLAIWSQVHGLALLRNEGLIAGMAQMRGKREEDALESIFDILRARHGDSRSA